MKRAAFFPGSRQPGSPVKVTAILAFSARGISSNFARVHRESVKTAARLVVKLGTGVLTDSRKQPDPAQLEQLVAQVAALRKSGKEIVLVTSGAVGAGMGALGYEKRPNELAELQACAAVGQPRLMATYAELFAKHGLHVAQVLLTHDDLEHHERHLNARNTLVTLLGRGVVPIINENDAVSFTEIKFGDNDNLVRAGGVAAARRFARHSDDGGRGHRKFRQGEPQRPFRSSKKLIRRLKKSPAARTAKPPSAAWRQKSRRRKSPCVPASRWSLRRAKRKTCWRKSSPVKTKARCSSRIPTKLQGRKRWIAFFHHPQGALFVDDGAKLALREKGKSLLPPGVARCEGEFAAGDVVRICDLNGTEFARGIARFDAAAVRARKLARGGTRASGRPGDSLKLNIQHSTLNAEHPKFSAWCNFRDWHSMFDCCNVRWFSK